MLRNALLGIFLAPLAIVVLVLLCAGRGLRTLSDWVDLRFTYKGDRLAQDRDRWRRD